MILINRGWTGLRRPFYQFFEAKQGQILKQIDDMVIFNNIDQLKLGSIIKNANTNGIVMGIFEKHSLALLLGKGNSQEIVQKGDKLFISGENNFEIKNINDKEGIEILREQHLKQNRKNNGFQIFTRNIFIDLFHPITNGQLLLMRDDKYLKKLNDFEQIVTYSNRNLQIDNQIIFKGNESQGGNYILPKVALEYAYNQSKQKKTLFIIDNIYDHMLSFQKIQELIFSYLYKQTLKTVYLSDYVKQLSDYCGLRENINNLTIAIVHRNENDDKLNSEVEKEVQIQYLLQIESLVSQELQNTIVKPTPMNKQLQSPLMYYLTVELYQVLSEYEQKKEEYTMKQKLKIHIDPWDFYAYFDRKPLLMMIKLFNESNDYSVEDMVVLIYWIIRVVKDETVTQLKYEPKQILDDIISFAHNFKEFNKMSFPQYYREMQIALDPLQFKNEMLESLGRFYELHSLHMRMTDQLLSFKKDYMNE